MASHFLTKSQADLAACIRIGPEIALESYPALRSLLNDKVSPEAARLFAEPLVSRGNDSAPATISWYCDLEGDAVPLAQLDEQARSAVDAKIADRLREIRSLLEDPDGGQLVGAALHVPALSDIWVAQGEPVILNWGMLSAPNESSEAQRSAQYAGALGRYLPMAAAPSLDRAARADSTASPAQDAEPTEAPKVEASAPPAAVIAERRGPTRAAVIPLVLLLLLAGGVLAWLLVPGTRLFPERAADAALSDAEAARIATSVNSELIARRDALRTALAGATCKADGTLLMPDGLTIEGLLPPVPGQPLSAPGSRVAGSPTPTLPPALERVRINASSADFLDHLEARTGMVVALGSDGGIGSGFFISPDLFLTNLHVVRTAPPDGVYVVHEQLGGRRPAKVLRGAGPFYETGKDFALLQVEGADQPFFQIADVEESLKLRNVVAAGYPADILATDTEFQALVNGDSAATPDLSLTSGTVSTEQNMGGLADVVVHSAPISQGNSGGPLVDMCGRVVGINTFVRQGSLRNLPVAIASSEILEFLAESGVQPSVVTQSCTPELLRPEAPPAAPDRQ